MPISICLSSIAVAKPATANRRPRAGRRRRRQSRWRRCGRRSRLPAVIAQSRQASRVPVARTRPRCRTGSWLSPHVTRGARSASSESITTNGDDSAPTVVADPAMPASGMTSHERISAHHAASAASATSATVFRGSRRVRRGGVRSGAVVVGLKAQFLERLRRPPPVAGDDADDDPPCARRLRECGHDHGAAVAPLAQHVSTRRAELPASRPVSGSSRMIRRGSCTSALTSATFWRMPFDETAALARAACSRASRAASCARACASSARRPAGRRRIPDIFGELVVGHRLVGNPGGDAWR